VRSGAPKNTDQVIEHRRCTCLENDLIKLLSARVQPRFPLYSDCSVGVKVVCNPDTVKKGDASPDPLYREAIEAHLGTGNDE
jgi:hypothetical protein